MGSKIFQKFLAFQALLALIQPSMGRLTADRPDWGVLAEPAQ